MDEYSIPTFFPDLHLDEGPADLDGPLQLPDLQLECVLVSEQGAELGFVVEDVEPV